MILLSFKIFIFLFFLIKRLINFIKFIISQFIFIFLIILHYVINLMLILQ